MLPSIGWQEIGVEVKLPKSTPLESKIDVLLFQRKSSRKFSSAQLSLNDLSSLLVHGVGQKSYKFAGQYGVVNSRSYPSPGARHSLEFYIVASACEGLARGVHHFQPHNKCLVQRCSFSPQFQLRELFGTQTWAADAPAVVMICSVKERIQVKYRDPNTSLRFGLLEAGHVAQNFSLIATSLKLAHCAIGGFNNSIMNQLTDLSNIHHSWVYCLAIGHSEN